MSDHSGSTFYAYVCFNVLTACVKFLSPEIWKKEIGAVQRSPPPSVVWSRSKTDFRNQLSMFSILESCCVFYLWIRNVRDVTFIHNLLSSAFSIFPAQNSCLLVANKELCENNASTYSLLDANFPGFQMINYSR